MSVKKVLINIFLLISILLVWITIIAKKKEDDEIEIRNTEIENITRKVEITKEEKQYPKETIVKKYKGYTVEAKLEIPDINLETYILQENTEKALNTAVVKIYGATPNHIGNLCVAGHNAPYNKNMFRDLKDLTIGERLYIIDNKIGKVEYEVYDIYKVFPEDVSCLLQETNGQKEVTLITCTNDSTQRRIIKAREVNFGDVP